MFGVEPEKVVDITTVDGCQVNPYIPSFMRIHVHIGVLDSKNYQTSMWRKNKETNHV